MVMLNVVGEVVVIISCGGREGVDVDIPCSIWGCLGGSIRISNPELRANNSVDPLSSLFHTILSIINPATAERTPLQHGNPVCKWQGSVSVLRIPV